MNEMKKISIVFLCGDRSPYGMAHLAVIAECFDVKAIIIADNDRWGIFRQCLLGGEIHCYTKRSKRFFSTIKEIAKKPLVLYRKIKHKKLLNSFGVPVIELNDANSKESIILISKFSPEVLISAAYPQIFDQKLISITPRGAVNFHPSLLPKFRGAHPHYWCLATGEKQSGVTAHFMTSRIDDGDIIAKRSFSLDNLYYADLYKKIIETTPELVRDVAFFLDDPNARPVPQGLNEVTSFRNDREIHRRLDFNSMNSQELFNRIRAGGGYTLHRGVRLYIEKVEVVGHNRHMTNNLSVPAGTIVDISAEGVVIFTVDHAFLVLKRVRWGRKANSFVEWVRKFDINIGEILV